MADAIITSMSVTDALGRQMGTLRLSVTDRCNFRCTYCMPKTVFGRDHEFLRREQLLTFEEIARVARVAVSLGVEKVRLTGGEPLLRKDVERLVAQLAEIPGLDQRPDTPVLRAGGRKSDLAEDALRQPLVVRDLDPGVTAVGRR